MIGHIFKKDVRLLWKHAAGVALAGGLGVLIELNTDRTSPLYQLWSLVEIIKVLGAGLLVAALVHQDSVPGVRQDWMIRPIPRRDLIAAKLVFVVVMIQVPAFLTDIVQLLAGGFPVGQSVKAGLIRAAVVLGVAYLPILGLASITRNFKETVIAVIAGVIGFVVLAQLYSASVVWHWRHVTLLSTGTDWIAELGMIAVVAIGGAVILVLQYLQRRTVPARFLAAGIVALCFSVNLLPWQPVFALQRRFSPQPGGASAVRLEFEPGRGRSYQPSIYGSLTQNRMVVHLPIRIDGLGADSILRTDLVQARLATPEGKVENLGFAILPLEMREARVRSGATGPYMALIVPVDTYQRLHDRPVRLELNYSLTLLRLEATHAMPAANGTQRIREFGRCRTSANPSTFFVFLECEQPDMTPPCAIVSLEHLPGGLSGQESIACSGSYSPFAIHPEPDTLRRLRMGLSYRNLTPAQIGEAQVVSRWYEVVEHFTRHVTIPDIRLSDWLAGS